MRNLGFWEGLGERGDIDYDYVLVFGEKYCESTKPDHIVSPGNNTTVIFLRYFSVSQTGFKATWEAVAN